jgi:DNA topoisomerase-1
MSKLLIVESPSKNKTIREILGPGWQVAATLGHIRALKEDLDALGFDPSSDAPEWNPTYEAIASKRAAISALRKAAASASEIYLASDNDREGEAIAFHTAAILGLNPATTPRLRFIAITESALKEAIAHPSRIDMNKFEAQQARSMLDLLIGYTLSPCLWRSVGFQKGLSAGRCQSPALRLVYERDEEIAAFASSRSWKGSATTTLRYPLTPLTTPLIPSSSITAAPISLTWTHPAPLTEERATAILTALAALPKEAQVLTITGRGERVSTHEAGDPFITSTLQKKASSQLGLNPKVTMKAAQTLYEAGHITYMRTDSATLSPEGREMATAVVMERWGPEYLRPDDEGPKKKKVVKRPTAKKKTEALEQGAHEAIRPTHMEVETLEDMPMNEQRLYRLIWLRTIQSVMADELRDCIRLTATAAADVTMETSWDRVKFPGFRVADEDPEAEAKEKEGEGDGKSEKDSYEALAPLLPGTTLPWSVFNMNEQQTTPPSRYSDADLIEALEKRKIGRPSTFASLVEVVKERGYVESVTSKPASVELRGWELKAGAKAPKATKRTMKTGGEKKSQGKLHTTALGRTVIQWLLSTFGDIIDYSVTAEMEAALDRISRGEAPWSSVLQSTWTKYADRYRSIMDSPPVAGSGGGGPNTKELGDGYKFVISKKGPLFVKESEVEGGAAKFASAPATLKPEDATLEDALAAFTLVTTGESLGTLGPEGDPVLRKTGKFGPYVTWKGFNLSCKADDTLETLADKLLAKIAPDAVDHQVGPYKIKRGERGNLYMFKTGGVGKPTFVSVPEDTDWKRLTLEGAEALYKSLLGEKKGAGAGRGSATSGRGSGTRGRGRGGKC